MKKSYSDWTYNSSNPIRRFAHRQRFKKSIGQVAISQNMSLLDFGCGDGLFQNKLVDRGVKEFKILGYEPYMKQLAANKVKIVSSEEDIINWVSSNGKFNYVTAFEVFEHFNRSRQEKSLEFLKSVLEDDGLLIISVPIENGFPALIKNFFRRINHPHHKHLYNFKNAWKSFLSTPLDEFRQEDKYLSHLGFYSRDFEKTLARHFEIKKKSFSPFSNLNQNFNSQIFYVLK